MRILPALLLALVLPTAAAGQTYVIEGGNVWDDEGFSVRDVYISDGEFVETRPAAVDSVIDARGAYVVPPFGDWHTHNFDGGGVRAADSAYIARGIFFSQDLVNDPLGRERNRAYLERRSTVDVAFANGALTSEYGHPIEGYERMALNIGWPSNDEERARVRESRIMENRRYYIIDSPSDVEDRVAALAATGPDVAKLVLWGAEEYGEAPNYPVENLGLDPALLPEIVEALRAEGLRPVAHIDSEFDMRVALDAGIRSFAHAPLYSYGNDGSIDADAPRLSAELLDDVRARDDVVVSPTLYRTFANLRYLPESRRPDPAEFDILRDVHRRLLLDLDAAEVSLVLGADFPGVDALDEALYWGELDAFSDAELLRMLIETAPRIFPDRRLGRITPGHEAHLLILEGDPTEEIERVEGIRARIKSGLLLPSA